MSPDRLSEAYRYAAALHASQLRKGTRIPYIAHLMAVAAIVLEHGGNEDQVVAALLHDAIEDHPRNGLTRREIGERFGSRVSAIVEDCTDADAKPKPPWYDRKVRYLEHLPKASPDSLLVSLADKVHNTRAILSDWQQIGNEVWYRFTASKEDTVWYYRSLANIYAERLPGPLADELERVVTELERIVETDSTAA